MKVEYFPRKNGYISKRNIELFEELVQPCYSKVSKCQAWETSTDPGSYLTRVAHFNSEKIDVLMKTWWINSYTFFGMLAGIFVFLFSNNLSISIYCLRIY